MRFFFGGILVPAFLTVFGAAALAGPDTMRVYEMDPVTVTGTHREALRSSVPGSVSVVGHDRLRRSGETSLLAVIARSVPGIYLTERGVLGYGAGPGAAGSIGIRGAGGSPNTQVLVLTDGRPQMMGLFGHPLPDTYVTTGVERVEIVRGPASLLHGTNAMGGVINIISRREPEGGLHARGSFSAGNYATTRAEAGAGYTSDRSSLSLSLSRHETHGHRPSSRFAIRSGSLRVSTKLTEGFTSSADVSLAGFRTYDPGPASAPRTENWVDILRGSGGISLENSTGPVQGALRLFFNHGNHEIYDGFVSSDHNAGILFHQGFTVFPGGTLTLGADFKRFGGEAVNRTRGLDFGSHAVEETGFYGLLRQDLAGIFTLSAGLRMNRGSAYGWEAAPQAGLAFRPAEGTALRISAARGFRSPTIRELYLFPAPTPTLKPERMWSYEAGILHQAGGFLEAEAAVFVNEGANMIRTGGVYPRLTLSNSGSFRHRGIECSALIRPGSGVEMQFAYTYLDPGAQTTANPRHKAYAGAALEISPLDFLAGVQYVGGLYGEDFSRKAMRDYATLHARLSARVGGSLSVFMAGENLLNADYAVIYDYPMSGATLRTGAEWGL